MPRAKSVLDINDYHARFGSKRNRPLSDRTKRRVLAVIADAGSITTVALKAKLKARDKKIGHVPDILRVLEYYGLIKPVFRVKPRVRAERIGAPKGAQSREFRLTADGRTWMKETHDLDTL